MTDPARLANETARAYDAFLYFVHLGPQRSQADVARYYRKHPDNIAKWAKRYSWKARSDDWDAENRRIENELAEIQKREDRQSREHWEQRRRQIFVQLAEGMARSLNELFQSNIRYTKQLENGQSIPVNTSAMMHAGILARELNRLAVGAAKDIIAEDDFRMRLAEGGAAAAAAVERIAGSFSVGDKVYESSESQPPVPEPKSPERPSEGEPHIDFSGTEGIYEREDK